MSRFSAFRTWIVVGVFCSAPALAQAQQQFGPGGEYYTHRSTPPNGTSIDVTYIAAGFSAPMSGAITQAAAVWNAAGANVQLVTTGGPSVFVLGLPGTVTPGTANSSVAGVGTYPDGTAWNHINFSTVQVDTTGPAWFVGPGSPAVTEVDFLSYMIQQFGYALGLGDVGADAGSVMNPLPAGTTQRTLSAGDIAALQTLYGAPEPATWALFGVGLAALGAMKKSRRRSTPAL